MAARARNIGHLLLALMGRLLYPVTCADNWRLTTWLWGESSCGKSTIINLVRKLLADSTVGEVTDSFEKTFGMFNLKDMMLASSPTRKSHCAGL